MPASFVGEQPTPTPLMLISFSPETIVPNPSTQTVTFLFTDIEGSTRLVLRLGERYPEVLEDHHRLIRDALTEVGGMEMGTAGDAVFASFEAPDWALQAAVQAQRSLASHRWPEGGAIRVRMGLHTGEAILGPTGYTGLAVHATARIADAGHGGQILMSEATHSVIGYPLPAGVSVRDLGEYHLKDLPEPEHLYQIEVPDLPGEFAPLRALDARPNNLPSELSEFIGREEELEAVSGLLASNRLVTLTGPGGSGKTRLALRAARDSLPQFSNGVFFVPLEAITDPDTLAPAVVQALEIKDTSDRPRIEVLEEKLRDRELLVVLDNFEHVLPAAVTVSRLLEVAPHLKALVTSRVTLGLRAEQSYEVPPLSLPDSKVSSDHEAMAQVDSVALFVRRSQAVQPDFGLTPDNAESVARIVSRLDGLPLALELAAARTREFAPPELASRLERSLDTLVGGHADLPQRQRTLRDAIAWSYDLLADEEQAVFGELGIFAGGFTLGAAEQVVAGASAMIVESVASLLDKSMLSRRVHLGETRFAMLETLREFALEELAESGKQEVAERYNAYFLSLAEEAEPELAGEAQGIWMARLLAERDNLRAVLRYSKEMDDPDTGLQLGAAVWRYWHGSGQLVEGKEWLEGFLNHPRASAMARAKGLTALAGLAYWQADFAQATQTYRQALDLYRASGDRFREADTLYGMSLTASFEGDPDAGERLAHEAKEIFEELESREQVGQVLMAEATAHWTRGDLSRAQALFERALDISLELGNSSLAASQMVGLAGLLFQGGDVRSAQETAAAALGMAIEVKNAHIQVFALDGVASFAAPATPAGAVRLAGAADSLREAQGGGWSLDSFGIENARVSVAELLPDDDIERAWEEGRGMSLEEAIDYARRLVPTKDVSHAREPT
ncbi:MAG: adenylate/guanylate cyclase domain-containing protein [Acidimicrobiia bacterium]